MTSLSERNRSSREDSPWHKKASASPSSHPGGGKTSAYERLDELLPFAEPSETEMHVNAAVLEVGDPAQLLELAADPGLRPFLLCRLAPERRAGRPRPRR